MLPSFLASKRDLGRYMLQYFRNSSLKIMFGRVSLGLEDCAAVLPKYGFSVQNWERKFFRSEYRPLEALIEDAAIQDCIRQRAEESRESVLGYLMQEGLFEDAPIGIVDLGWAGVFKGAFEGLLSLRGRKPLPFFFFARSAHDSKDDESALHAYFFNLAKGVGIKREQTGITILMEMFCASLADGLRRYEMIDGRYEPVFHPSNSEAVREWGTGNLAEIHFAIRG